MKTKVKQLTSVSRSMQHYGRYVFYQKGNMDFKGLLRRQEIPFTELPDLWHDIVFYRYNHGDKYAVIISDDLREQEVYITNAIPLDMSWDLLVEDCRSQMRGNHPMEMDTKAKLILDVACNQVICGIRGLMDSPELLTDSNVCAIRMAIDSMGYKVKDLEEMDHHDIDLKIWNTIIK